MDAETAATEPPKHAVILGGGGFIGAACAAALDRAGFRVTRVGRTRPVGDLSRAEWLTHDLTKLSGPDWRRILSGADVIVNAAGALQDGGGDDLASVHVGVVRRMVAVAEQSALVIQISSVGVGQGANTAFLRTKAEGDAVLKESALDWVILRPGLVIGRPAYGGSAMLRAAAAAPVIGVDMAGDAPIQTVALDDLAAAVVRAATGEVPAGTEADLVSKDVHTLSEVVALMRRWLGFPPWRFTLRAPPLLVRGVALIADGLAHFGWRSPLRTTAMRVLADGVTGDPGDWSAAGGAPCLTLTETLRDTPSTTQDRWHARAFLAAPLVLAVLAAFWLAAGLIGLARSDAAMAVLTHRGWSVASAELAVATGSVVDIALGLGVIWRRTARLALRGMIAVTLCYCIGAAIWAPDLWVDPLGPMIKAIPAAVLALIALPMLDRR